MPIVLNAIAIKVFHEFLVLIYKGLEFPEEIIDGYNNEGLVDACVDLSMRDTLMDVPLYPSIFQKAASLCYYLNVMHPFTDGNKRTSLCSLFYMLLWNGYIFEIPSDAAIFLEDIADITKNITWNMVYEWIIKNTISTKWTKLRHYLIIISLIMHSLWELSLFDKIISYLLFRPLPAFVMEVLRRREYEMK